MPFPSNIIWVEDRIVEGRMGHESYRNFKGDQLDVIKVNDRVNHEGDYRYDTDNNENDCKDGKKMKTIARQ